jgi:hypothetical protein
VTDWTATVEDGEITGYEATAKLAVPVQGKTVWSDCSTACDSRTRPPTRR